MFWFFFDKKLKFFFFFKSFKYIYFFLPSIFLKYNIKLIPDELYFIVSYCFIFCAIIIYKYLIWTLYFWWNYFLNCCLFNIYIKFIKFTLFYKLSQYEKVLNQLFILKKKLKPNWNILNVYFIKIKYNNLRNILFSKPAKLSKVKKKKSKLYAYTYTYTYTYSYDPCYFENKQKELKKSWALKKF
jgi:hypothetical protein